MSYLDEDQPVTWRHLLFPGDRARPRLVWWKPPWPMVLRQAGIWWVLVLPFVASMALILASLSGGPEYFILSWLGGRLLLISLLLPLLVWDHLRHKAYRARRDPFCIHCGYTLIGLPDEGACPECGRPFRMKTVKMFRRDPQWVIAFWRINGRPPTLDQFSAGHQGKRG